MDDELRYDQIGAILGCSVAAVKVRIHRARLQPRSEMSPGRPARTRGYSLKLLCPIAPRVYRYCPGSCLLLGRVPGEPISRPA
jgi:hypothetical protein